MRGFFLLHRKLVTTILLLNRGMNVAAAAKPNILVIMADDVGWASLQAFPPRGPAPASQAHVEQQASGENGLAQ
jgi:hypothetical protein